MQPLDILILLFIGIGIFAGYSKGFINQTASLLGVLVGLYLAKKYYLIFAEELYPALVDSQSSAAILSFIGIWLVFPIALGILSALLTRFFDAIYLGVLNRLLGSIFGVIKYALLLSVLLCLLDYFDTENKWLSEKKKDESTFYQPIKSAGEFLFFTIKGAYLSL